MTNGTATAYERTTAAMLGQYRRELLAEGIPEEVADNLVMHAAVNQIHDIGISVRTMPDGPPDAD